MSLGMEYVHMQTHSCIHMQSAPMNNFSALCTSVWILAVCFQESHKSRQAIFPSAGLYPDSQLERDWDRENNARLRSSCYAVKKHKLLDLEVGIQNSFLCTIYNVITVLLAAPNDSCRTILEKYLRLPEQLFPLKMLCTLLNLLPQGTSPL